MRSDPDASGMGLREGTPAGGGPGRHPPQPRRIGVMIGGGEDPGPDAVEQRNNFV